MNAKSGLLLIAKKFTIATALILAASLTYVLFMGCSKDKPTGPGTPSPDILIFSITPNDIVPPDSALVTWKTASTDSVKIFPPGQKLMPTDSGQIYVKPATPTLYSLVAYAAGKKDSMAVPVIMSALAANIGIFQIDPDTLIDGDSSIITWKTTQADSIVINQGVGNLSPVDSGQLTIFPLNTVGYRAVAYSIYGNDTVTINIRVKKPVLVRTIGGAYYKGLMGSSTLSPALSFAVADAGSNLLGNMWINLRVLEGDGVLSPADSVLTNSSGLGNVTYNFSGLLGHAVISANFRDVDTVEAYLRANTIIPGLGGQGQYILFSDKFSVVLSLNGAPERVVDDPRPDYLLTYAEYLQSAKVVFVVLDPNNDGQAQEDENVFSIILTSEYTGKTKDSIGIGSDYNEIKSVYGQPDSAFFSPADAENPAAIGLIYNSIGTVFYIDTVTGTPLDTNKATFEIHLQDPSFFRTQVKYDRQRDLRTNFESANYRRILK